MNNNISMETIERQQQQAQQQQQQAQQQQQQAQQQQPNITDIEIIDENTALNVMVSFLHLAQKRGAFNLQESAKAWECVKVFMRR
jgi:hypothetical protein